MKPRPRQLERWWNRRTIRFRLALWYGAGGTLLLTLFAATLYFYVAARIARPLDHQLRADLALVEANLTVAPDHTLLWQGKRIPRTAPRMTGLPWFELWDEDDHLVRRVWPFSESRALRSPPPPNRINAETGVISVFNVAPEIRLRALSVRFQVPGRPTHWMLRLMRIHQPYRDTLPELRVIILVALPIVVTLLVLGGHFFTRRWLLPLDLMADEANRITIDDLSRRLPVGNAHDELGRLANIFNVTLDRLQNSFEALDRFVADASHELRTPLTTLRSVGEVGLRRSRTVEEYREIIGSMLEEAQRLQLLVQRLLELASAEGGGHGAHRRATNIGETAAECVNELGILAEQKNQRLTLEADDCIAKIDPVLFRQALQNLIDNAIKYSPEDTAISVSVREQDETIHVSVSDEGPGIDPIDREHLTERFFRPDRSRQRDSGGFGLGLSITKAYLRALGGTLEYEARVPCGSTFRLLLPKQ